MAEESDLNSYHGGCHCGAFQFSVRLEPLKQVSYCNCSFCIKIGYLWAFPSKNEHFVIEKGEGCLVDYTFASKTTIFKFCPTCGTSVMAVQTKMPEAQYNCINVCVLEGVDLKSLKVTLYDGASL